MAVLSMPAASEWLFARAMGAKPGRKGAQVDVYFKIVAPAMRWPGATFGFRGLQVTAAMRQSIASIEDIFSIADGGAPPAFASIAVAASAAPTPSRPSVASIPDAADVAGELQTTDNTPMPPLTPPPTPPRPRFALLDRTHPFLLDRIAGMRVIIQNISISPVLVAAMSTGDGGLRDLGEVLADLVAAERRASDPYGVFFAVEDLTRKLRFPLGDLVSAGGPDDVQRAVRRLLRELRAAVLPWWLAGFEATMEFEETMDESWKMVKALGDD